METIKAFSDLEQSKKLAEILPFEGADMYYCYGMDIHTKKCGYDIVPTIIDADNQIDICDIPCWSLATLLGVLPEIQGGKPVISLDDNYITYPHMSDLHTKADNLVDACVAMIIKLSELKML